ncbi:unnamed protein product [Phaeothamnion confervicola]
MDFLDPLRDGRVASSTGCIRGCYEEELEGGLRVQDKLREMLANPESENADLFSVDQRREFFFHLFRHLAVGGAMCQPEDTIDAYLDATKKLYKELVSVCRDPDAAATAEVASGTPARIAGGGTDGRGTDGGGGGKGGGVQVVTRVFEVKSVNGDAGALFPLPAAAAGTSPHSACYVLVDPLKRQVCVMRKAFAPFW